MKKREWYLREAAWWQCKAAKDHEFMTRYRDSGKHAQAIFWMNLSQQASYLARELFDGAMEIEL